MNCSTPGLPVHHQLREFTQTHVHRVSDAIQPSHPLSSPSPPAPNPSQHQGLLQWLLKLINQSGKVTEYKIKDKNLAFLYTENKSSKREIKETIPFTIISKEWNT